MRVLVVGGGVIGLCTAAALVRRGVEVEVLEAGRCGEGASWGSAGWVVPALSAPLAAPGAVREALAALPRPGGPVRVRPALEPWLVAFLWRLWRASTAARHRAGLEAMLALNARTFPLLDELRALGVAFEMHADGLLFTALRAERLEAEVRLLEELRDLGYPGEVRRVGRHDLPDFEPALGSEVAGAVHATADRHVRPETLTRGLVDWLRGQGALVVEERAAERLRIGAGRIEAVEHAGGESRGDAVVLACGAWTGRLLAGAGVQLPLAAAKGYSVTAEAGEPRPRRPLYLAEARLALTPFDGAVRLAGSFELGGLDLRLHERRLLALQELVPRFVPAWSPSTAGAWTGLRPLTADGLPAIGPIPGIVGLHVSTGHGMLGVTLAPASGEALAERLVSGRLPRVLAPFDPARLCRRR